MAVSYHRVQIATFAILFLAGNTGFQAFPQLSSFLPRDKFLPRWLSLRGSRLVYDAGILLLAVLASALIIIYQADEIAMLPLYAIGVMLSFSISQAGMFHLMGRVAHLKPGEELHTKVTTIHFEKNVPIKRVLYAIGSSVTFLVFLVLLLTKFLEGAWIVAVIIPVLIFIFYSIRKHYWRVASALSTHDLQNENITDIADIVLIPIEDIHRGTLQALKYAQRLSTDVRALVVVTSDEMKARLLARWNRFPSITENIQLVMIDYDYRDILTPLVAYIEKVNNTEFADKIITVVIPEFIPENKMAAILHNQTAMALKGLLDIIKTLSLLKSRFIFTLLFEIMSMGVNGESNDLQRNSHGCRIYRVCPRGWCARMVFSVK